MTVAAVPASVQAHRACCCRIQLRTGSSSPRVQSGAVLGCSSMASIHEPIKSCLPGGMTMRTSSSHYSLACMPACCGFASSQCIHSSDLGMKFRTLSFLDRLRGGAAVVCSTHEYSSPLADWVTQSGGEGVRAGASQVRGDRTSALGQSGGRHWGTHAALSHGEAHQHAHPRTHSSGGSHQ